MEAPDIAKELIKFETCGPLTTEQPCAEWIRDYLEDTWDARRTIDCGEGSSKRHRKDR